MGQDLGRLGSGIGAVIIAAVLAMGVDACVDGTTADPGDFPAAALTSIDGARVRVELRTAPDQPPIRGSMAADLAVTDLVTGAPVAGLTIVVEPWMPSMGHGTGSTPLAVDAGHGHYQIDELGLFMAGGWVLRLTITGFDGDGVDELELPVEVQ